jgi:hypothetical protein
MCIIVVIIIKDYKPAPGQSWLQSPQCLPSWGTSLPGWMSKAHHDTPLSESAVVHFSYVVPLYLNGNTHAFPLVPPGPSGPSVVHTA